MDKPAVDVFCAVHSLVQKYREGCQSPDHFPVSSNNNKKKIGSMFPRSLKTHKQRWAGEKHRFRNMALG